MKLWQATELQRAEKIARAFVWVQRAMWSSMWPLGHCGVSSLLLNPQLTAPMPDQEWAVVVGNYKGRAHAWIESFGGDIVDITWGQFGDAPTDWPLLVLPAHEAASRGHFAEIRLSPQEEDFYRRSINPHEYQGWHGRSKIKHLFSDYPRTVLL